MCRMFRLSVRRDISATLIELVAVSTLQLDRGVDGGTRGWGNRAGSCVITAVHVVECCYPSVRQVISKEKLYK